MNNLRSIISKHLSGKKVLLLFVLTNLVYAVMIFLTIPKVMAFSGDMKLLDMMPTGYDLDYVNRLFNTLGEKGRESYLYHQIPVDMIYPFLFGISYSLILAYLLNKLGKLNSVFFSVSLLPLLAGMADYLENIGIVVMLTNFPNISSGLAGLTNVFSITKSMTTTLFFIVLIILLVSLGVKTLTTLKKGKKSR
jgi:hypothetical protein